MMTSNTLQRVYRPQDVADMALKVRRALSDLGYKYTTRDGSATLEIVYKRLSLAGQQFALLEVDTERLPPRVSIPKIETADVLTHLSSVIGKPVRRINHVGLTYVVCLQPPAKPKPFPTSVTLPPAPESLEYPFPFGMTREGVPIWGSLLNTGHILVGGYTGGGKSTLIQAALVSLLQRHGPDTLRLALVDPKRVEFNFYNGLPHLLMPVAKEPEEASEVVLWLVNEMKRRESLFAERAARNFETYNATAPQPLPMILAVFDEVTDLVLQWGGTKTPVFKELIRLSVAARAFGIVLLFATQNPKAEILDTFVRGNCKTRVALKVNETAQSKTILGIGGAEKLPAKPGRMIVMGLDPELPVTLQGFMVTDEAITKVTHRLRTVTVTPLTGLEAEMVLFARDNADLKGAFTVNKIYPTFRDRISNPQLRALAQRWETRGWLTHPADATSPRRLTSEVIRLAENTQAALQAEVKAAATAKPVAKIIITPAPMPA